MSTRAQHRVLIVGAGSIGERHARCFGATGRADVSIVEPRETIRSAVNERYSLSNAFARIEDAPLDQFDAAVIATPAPSHIPIALQLAGAGAGIHLLIEKPLSLTTDGIEELKQVAGNQRIVVAVAYVYRAHPALAAMRNQISRNHFGRPLEIVATCGQHFPTYRPAYRDTYYASRASGGGAIQDALTHIMDAGQWLVGPIDRVVADASHQALEGVEVEDTVHVLTRHGGIMGCYSMNQYQAPLEVSITVVCERGTARFESHESRWRWMTDNGGNWHDEPAHTPDRDTIFIHQANRFLDAVEAGSLPPGVCSLDQGLHDVRVNLAMLQSSSTGQWCHVIDVKEIS